MKTPFRFGDIFTTFYKYVMWCNELLTYSIEVHTNAVQGTGPYRIYYYFLNFQHIRSYKLAFGVDEEDSSTPVKHSYATFLCHEY